MKLSKVLTVLTLVVLLSVVLGCTQKTAADIDCEQLTEMFIGYKYGEVEVSMVKDYKQISRSPTSLVCSGYPRAKGWRWAENPFTFTYEQLPDGTWEKAMDGWW